MQHEINDANMALQPFGLWEYWCFRIACMALQGALQAGETSVGSGRVAACNRGRGGAMAPRPPAQVRTRVPNMVQCRVPLSSR